MDLQVIVDELREGISSILATIPHLTSGLIVLVIGYLLARGVRWLLRVFLNRLGFDQRMDERGLGDALRRIGVTTPLSRLLAQAVFLLLLLSFAVTSARLMGLRPVADILERVLIFLPSIIAATVVFIIASLAASYAGELVSRAGRANRLGFATLAGRGVQLLLFFFAIVLAIGVLGVNTAILVTVITVTVSALGLTLSLALGLGARQLMGEVLAGYYVRERFPVGQRIRIRNVVGVVSGVGGVNTTITVGSETLVIPNSVLIQQVVRVAPAEPPAGATPERPAPPPPETKP